MPFTGKATYSAGASLPELAEDVSDVIGIVSPFETPLLDHLGDPRRAATSTIHEWIEDELLPNTDTINDATYTDAAADTAFVVDHASRFRVGDQVQATGSREVMLVTAINTGTNTLTVVRGYGGTTSASWATRRSRATTAPPHDSPAAPAGRTTRRSSPPPSRFPARRWPPDRSPSPTSWITRSRSVSARCCATWRTA